MHGRPVAAIACGTNSTRLLVVDTAGAPLAREMRVTRLGRGVETTREMASDTIDDTVAVLREYRRTIDAFAAHPLRLVATAAARDAANRDVFFAAAEAAVGVRPELLSGEEEARLSLRSATARLDGCTGRVLVVDIGGGSTEFAVGFAEEPPGEPEGLMSVDIGCVRLTERCLTGDPPGLSQVDDALSLIRDSLRSVSRALPTANDATHMVLVGGTVAHLPAVMERLILSGEERANHSVLPLAAVEDLLGTLAAQKRHDRVCGPGLEAALSDVMLGGTSILVAIMRHFRFEHCLISEADLLDGLVLSLLHSTWTRRDSSEGVPIGGPCGGRSD
jgi:exopolyphosphatase/guanosine-5'-triphosphate,3'-diphosphate pyrophosphatase